MAPTRNLLFPLPKASFHNVMSLYRWPILGQFSMKYVGCIIHVSLISVAAVFAHCQQVVHVAEMREDLSRPVHNTLQTCSMRTVCFFWSSLTCLIIRLLDWAFLKGRLESPSEVFLNLACNLVQRPLFEMLREANYETLFHELFTHRGESSQDWTKQDWLCINCIREFFVLTVFRWWRARKVQSNIFT